MKYMYIIYIERKVTYTMSVDTSKKGVNFSFVINFPTEYHNPDIQWHIVGLIQGYYYGIMSKIEERDQSLLSFFRDAKEDLEYYICGSIDTAHLQYIRKFWFAKFEQEVIEEEDHYTFRIHIDVDIEESNYYVFESPMDKKNHKYS